MKVTFMTPSLENQYIFLYLNTHYHRVASSSHCLRHILLKRQIHIKIKCTSFKDIKINFILFVPSSYYILINNFSMFRILYLLGVEEMVSTKGFFSKSINAFYSS